MFHLMDREELNTEMSTLKSSGSWKRKIKYFKETVSIQFYRGWQTAAGRVDYVETGKEKQCYYSSTTVFEWWVIQTEEPAQNQVLNKGRRNTIGLFEPTDPCWIHRWNTSFCHHLQCGFNEWVADQVLEGAAVIRAGLRRSKARCDTSDGDTTFTSSPAQLDKQQVHSSASCEV